VPQIVDRVELNRVFATFGQGEFNTGLPRTTINAIESLGDASTIVRGYQCNRDRLRVPTIIGVMWQDDIRSHWGQTIDIDLGVLGCLYISGQIRGRVLKRMCAIFGDDHTVRLFRWIVIQLPFHVIRSRGDISRRKNTSDLHVIPVLKYRLLCDDEFRVWRFCVEIELGGFCLSLIPSIIRCPGYQCVQSILFDTQLPALDPTSCI